MICSVALRKLSLLERIADTTTAVRATELNIQKLLPTFEKEADLTETIAGTEAVGFRYHYTAQSTLQTSEYYLLKYAGFFISISCTTRASDFDRNHPVFRSLIESIRLS